MNHHKIDRYRGSCLLVSNGRGRGTPHAQSGRPFLEGRSLRSQVGWQCPRGRPHMSSVCHFEVTPHSMGFIYEGTPTLPVPVYSFPPFRRGSVGHRTHSMATGTACPPFLNRPSSNSYSTCPTSSCLCPPNSNVVASCTIPSNVGTTWYLRSQATCGEFPLVNYTIKDEIEQLPMSRLALQPDKKEVVSSISVLNINREEEREDSLSPPSSSDTVSVTSDEGSGGAPETMLPRIIKPRKRRKKDRKPPPSAALQCSSDLNMHPSNATTAYLTSSMRSEDHSKTVVTLKPYIPICFQSEGQTSPPCCSQCPSPLLFPTPPPSPAASIANSSCSEDETIWPPVATMGVAEKGVLVRSYSAPHPPTSAAPFVSRIRISSTVTHSFNGHREIDLRLFSVEPTQSIPIPPPPPPRLRHFSTPCPTRRKIQAIEFTPSIAAPPRKYIPESYWREMQELAVRTPSPTEREWVPLAEPNNTRATCIFTVLCYNVLCDKFATRQMYGYCPPWALEWTYRKKGIMDEVRRCSADIITLQEVETEQFFNFFLPELKKENYDGIFSPKSRAKHMSESERKFVDGCAIFWRTTKFTLAEEHLIEFNQLAMANHDGSEDMLNRVMTKDNIGLAALLHTTENAWGSILPDKNQICQPILVCTAHIHWDPEFCDVKLIQTIMLMSEIRGIVSSIVEESRTRIGPKLDFNDIHLMLCGDLNSLPESGVIEFLMKGSVSMDHDDFKGLGYKTPLQKIALSKNHNAGLVNTATNSYTHSFHMSATYDNSIMAYTNYTYDFKGIIDYIFHSYNSIRTLGVLGPIDPEWFSENKIVGCPHPHVPSDHFPLLVELELSLPNSTPHPNGLLHR